MNLAQLFNPVEKIVGLEIASDHIRAVLLDKNKKGVLSVIKKSAPLPAGAVSRGRIANREELISALKKLVQTNRDIFKSRYAILALPPMHAFTDIMKFPPVAQDQIAESIVLNINTKTMFPVEASDVYYDWQPARSEDPYYQEIMLSFAMKDYIDEWMSACETAGLEPLAFEATPLSIARALENFQDKTGALLRIGREGIEISIVSNNELRFSRFVSMPDMGTFDLFKDFLSGELTRVFNFYAIENPRSEPVKNLAIISQLEKEKEIGDWLAGQLGISMQKPHFSHSAQIEESYAAAYGAALRGLIKRENDTLVSLMPVGTEETYRRRRFMAYISLWSDIVNATAVILVALFIGALFLIQAIEKRIDTQIVASQTASAISEQISELEKYAARFNQSVGRMALIEDGIYHWSNLLKELPDALAAPGISINKVDIKDAGGNLVINLTAETRAAAVSFRKTLEEDSRYENITMPFLDITQKENININITLKLKNDPGK